MKKSILLTLAVILLSSLNPAQNIKVTGIREITPAGGKEFYFPKFSHDNSKILLTKSNFKGLYSYDMKTGKLTTLTKDNGAGYEYSLSGDDQFVYYRSDNYIKGRKYSKLIAQNFSDLSKTVIVNEKRNLSPPKVINGGNIFYTLQSKINVIEKKNFKRKTISSLNTTFVTVQNCKLALFRNGIKIDLKPLGSGNYIWASLSPDKTKILFTLAGKGTFISDLNGKILTKLGYADYPKWSPDGKWISYMVDKDDGYTVTSSDLFVKSVDGSKTVQLTKTNDIHEMYPEWSPDGREIVCNSSNGRIFIVNVEEY